eukprot:4471081-Prymnesium_polylepis.1
MKTLNSGVDLVARAVHAAYARPLHSTQPERARSKDQEADSCLGHRRAAASIPAHEWRTWRGSAPRAPSRRRRRSPSSTCG